MNGRMQREEISFACCKRFANNGSKKQKFFRQKTPKTPRFAENFLSASLGDFGAVRRINFFLFGYGLG
jgi:hypothetical protein